jgi:anthranilate phosphoribosyltransferase
VDISGLDFPVDIVGTGGDASGTFNVSTTAMFVAAAAGCHVAKHGNRSVSSKSGAADVLEAAGVRLNLTPEQVARCVREVGVGFMFAPGHHSAMKHAIGPRRELGRAHRLQCAGPLTNPAGVPNQLLGVFSESLLQPLAEVLQRLGSRHVLVVHARTGWTRSASAPRPRWRSSRTGRSGATASRPSPSGWFAHPSMPSGSTTPSRASPCCGRARQSTRPAARHRPAQRRAAIYAAGRAPSLVDGLAQADAAIASGEAARRLAAPRRPDQRPWPDPGATVACNE